MNHVSKDPFSKCARPHGFWEDMCLGGEGTVRPTTGGRKCICMDFAQSHVNKVEPCGVYTLTARIRTPGWDWGTKRSVKDLPLPRPHTELLRE